MAYSIHIIWLSCHHVKSVIPSDHHIYKSLCLYSQLRYTAYRTFVRWIWGVLGKDVRVVNPACVVRKIRQHFPSASNLFVGFKMAPVSED